MLFPKSTRSLRLSPIDHDSPMDSPILKALRGLYCNVCDRPLTSASAGPIATLSCCGQEHCPYCGAPETDRCPHLFARYAHGRWSIAGLHRTVERQQIELIEAVRLSDRLFGWNDTQLQAAFGAAWSVVQQCFHANLSPHHAEVPTYRVVRAVLSAVTGVADGARRFQCYPFSCYFVPDRAAAIRRFRKVMADFQNGWERMNAITPFGSDLLCWQQSIVPDTGRTGVYVAPPDDLAYLPDGTMVAALYRHSHRVERTTIVLLDAVTGSVRHICSPDTDVDKRFDSGYELIRRKQDIYLKEWIAGSTEPGRHYAIRPEGLIPVDRIARSGRRRAAFPPHDVRMKRRRLDTLALYTRGTGRETILRFCFPPRFFRIAPDGKSFVFAGTQNHQPTVFCCRTPPMETPMV